MRELTKSEKISLSTTEIAKLIRKQLKAEFKGCKFSVRTEYYSMGSSITVALMKADIRIKGNITELDDYTLARYRGNGYTRDEIVKFQAGDYHQLNEYILRRKYDSYMWCNGVFLTERGHALLRRVVQIADYYNYDDSDSMTDYYSVNYSFHLHLGKYDKPFIDGTGTKTDAVLDARIRQREEEVTIHRHQLEVEQAKKDKIDKLEAGSHVAKSRRAVQQVESILSATAIFDGKGFELQTPGTRARRILELDEVRQAAKVQGIDWSKEVIEL